MGRLFLAEYDQIPSEKYIHCGMCRTRVAFVEDDIAVDVSTSLTRGIYSKVFNVEVPADDLSYHQQENGNTLVDTYCVKCGMLLGWKLIAVPQPCMYFKEGRFLMKMHKLYYWDELLYNDQVGGANEQGPKDQDTGANEQNADQDGGANEQDPNDQDVGANEQNPNQDGGVNEQIPNEQNADQVGDANEQDHDQDGGAPMN